MFELERVACNVPSVSGRLVALPLDISRYLARLSRARASALYTYVSLRMRLLTDLCLCLCVPHMCGYKRVHKLGSPSGGKPS